MRDTRGLFFAVVTMVAAMCVADDIPLTHESDGTIAFGNDELKVRFDCRTGCPIDWTCNGRTVFVRTSKGKGPVGVNCFEQEGEWGYSCGSHFDGIERMANDAVRICSVIGMWRLGLHVRLCPSIRSACLHLDFEWMGESRTEFNGVVFNLGEVMCSPGRGSYLLPGVYPPGLHERDSFIPGTVRQGWFSFSPVAGDDGDGHYIMAFANDMRPYSDKCQLRVEELANGYSIFARFRACGYAREHEVQSVGDVWLRFGSGDAEKALLSFHDFYRDVGLMPPSDRPERVRDLIIYSTHPKGRAESGAVDSGGFNFAATYLPFIKALGANCIWVRPTYHRGNYTPDRIYEQQDGVGSADDEISYVRAAHRLGMEVLSDVVPHGGRTDNARSKEHPEWVCWKKDGTFQDDYWAYDFNWPTWVKYQSDWVEWRTRKFELDGWRMDVPTGSRFPNWNSAIPYARASYSRRQGGISQHREIRAAARRANPEAFILGEENEACWATMTDAIYDQLLCHVHYHAFREDDATNVVSRLRRWFHEQHHSYIPDTVWMRYPESHDSRLACNVWGRSCANALMALSAWVDGFPLVCNEGEDGCFESWRRIFAVKRALPELRRGTVDYLSVEAPPGVFACRRALGELESVFYINFNNRRVTFGQFDLPAYGYQIVRTKGPSVREALATCMKPCRKPFIPERKGPERIVPAPGGIVVSGGLVAELRDLTNGVVSAQYSLSGEPTDDGVRIVVRDAEGLDFGRVKLLVRFPKSERWFAHAAEGSFESPYFVRHPGTNQMVRCRVNINGARWRDPTVCWSNGCHPFGFARTHAEVGSASGELAHGVGGFSEGVSVCLHDRLGDDEGLALSIAGSTAEDLTCEIRKMPIREAFASREPATDDDRLRPISGGWVYDDGKLKVRFSNSGMVVGAWRRRTDGSWSAELGHCGWRGTKTMDYRPTLGWRLHDENVSEQSYDCYARQVFRRGADGSLILEFSDVRPALFGRPYLDPPTTANVSYVFRGGRMEVETSFVTECGKPMTQKFGNWAYRMSCADGCSDGVKNVIKSVKFEGALPFREDVHDGVHDWVYHDKSTGDFKMNGNRAIAKWGL